MSPGALTLEGAAGLLLWALESALALAAASALTWRCLPERGFLVRSLATGLVASASVLLCVQTLGLLQLLQRPVLAAAGLGVHGAMLAWALQGGRARAWAGRLVEDVRAPARLARDVARRGELAAWAFVPAGFGLAVSAVIVASFPSWSWDVVWYHVPKTNYAVQNGGLGWVATHIPYINGYPQATELLAVWQVLLVGDTRLDDLPQLPFVLLGGLAVALLARRSEASPALAASLGAMWMALPAVALQAHTTHADVMAGALFVTGVAFLMEQPWTREARWLTCLALGLYLGTKVTGLFHLVLLSPLLLWRIGAQWRRERRAGDVVLSLVLLLALGGWPYVQNVLHTGNPLWPARVKLPLLGWVLPGTMDPNEIAGPPAFFGAPGAFGRMVSNWIAPEGLYFPDVRQRAYGWLFPALLLPCWLWTSVSALWSRDRWQRLTLALLGVLAVLVPAAWWGRFTLGLPAAGLVAFAIVHRDLRTAYLRVPLSAVAAFLCVAGYAKSFSGYLALPHVGTPAVPGLSDEARLRKEANWLWPPRAARLREQELQRGDVVAYDESVSFLGELWTQDLRNRVVHVRHLGSDAEYLGALREHGAKWVSVGRSSAGERALRSQGGAFEPLFALPRSGAVMYRARW